MSEMNTTGEPRKQTEIGEIPKSWKMVRLGDLVKLKSGVSRPKDMGDKPDAELTVPVYGGNGVLGYTSKESSKQRLLVIGRVGEYCGCVHIAESPNWITDNALYSERWFNSEISLNFLAEQLMHFNLNRLKRRGGQPLITQTIIHELKISLPPLPEQRAIAHVLQTIQEAKAARQRELALERERKAALMDYLFSHGTKDEPRKQTEIGEIPESWEVVRLEDVCTFTTGKLNSEQATADGQYPFFTCSQETFRIDSYSFDQEAMLLAGNNARGIYSVKYYKGRFDAYQRTYVITIEDTKRLSYQYFLYDLFLRLELLRRQSIGATTKYLTAPIIKNLGLALPPPSEQLMISSVFWSCDEKIAALEQEAERLDELFHAMLDELMTGQRSAVPLIDSELLS